KFLATMLIGILLSTNVWGADPGTWSKITSLSGISDGDMILITSYKASSTGAASGTNYYSVPGGKTLAELSLSNNLPSGIDDTKCWKFVSTGTANEYYIMSGDKYMSFGTSNDGVSYGSTQDIMTISTYQTSYFSIQDGTNSRYLTLYSNSDWRCYTSQYNATTTQNARLILYKWTATSTTPVTSLDLYIAGDHTDDKSGHNVGDSYTLPTEVTAECGDKVLVGWSTVEIPTPGAKPTSNYYDKGAEVTLAATNIFYAVFADASSGATISVTKDIIAEGGPSSTVTLNDDNNPHQMGELPITLTGIKGTSNYPAINYNSKSGTDLRFYKGTTCAVTFATTNDQPITKIEFKKNSTTISNLGTSFSANVGTLSANVWTGSANSVTITYNDADNNFKEEMYIINVTYTTSGTSYSAYTTTCKACESEVTVTKSACEHGSFTVSKETVCADDAGGSVTVTCTPNEHYHVSAVTATVGTVTGSGNSYTVSGITAATEIAVTFAIDQQITVTWNVNGTATPQILWPGEHVTALPEAPTVMPTCANTFMGWSTETLIGEGNDAPTDLFNKIEDLPEITTDVTFNAVFAKAEGSGKELWTKVTDLTQVGEGEYAILVNAENPYAFSGSVSSSGHGESTSQIFNFDSNGQATSAPGGTCVLTIAAVENGYTMYCAGKGYLYAKAASSGNLAWSSNAPSRYWNTHTKDDVTNWSYYGTTNSEPWYAHIRMYSTTLRTYGNNSGSAVIFVKKGTGTTYSNYVTTCATYTVTWRSNDYQIRVDADKAPGTVLTAPTVDDVRDVNTKAACGDHLVGWMPAASTTNPKVKQDEAPAEMVGQQVTVTDNVVYHAVYADVAGE
ncbi:MAG: hypothetical protein MJZ20_13935, partial [Bacteroidaceae bacterium]|nr:hypothetical protein [Bacteroidaceae bacterium]